MTARIATPDGERTVRASYLIGADGGSSSSARPSASASPARPSASGRSSRTYWSMAYSSDAWHRWGEDTAAQVSMCPLYGTAMFQLQAPIPFDVDIDLSGRGADLVPPRRTGRNDAAVIRRCPGPPRSR